MKVTKVFSCVLGLHFGVIAILLVQPGCESRQPPTQIYTQERTMRSSVEGASRDSGGLIPATRVGTAGGISRSEQSLGDAFNAGFDDGRFAPDGSDNEFGEFDRIAPITPLSADGQTVDVAGDAFETYTVKRGDSLWSISKRYDVSLNELYAANQLNKNSVLRVGQQIEIPVEGGSASVDTVNADTYQPSSFNQNSTDYTVQRGDTLSKIANQFDTSVRAIKAANDKTSDLIRVGESLVIPVGANAATSSTPSDSSSGSSAQTTSTRADTTTSGNRSHTVKAGEFPATIARQYGMTTGELLALNGITDPRRLQVGQVLKVSGSGSAANVDSRTETVASRGSNSSPSTSTSTSTSSFPAPRPAPAPSSGPVEIRVIEADPLVEGEVDEMQADEMFEGAVEIPVIRLED